MTCKFKFILKSGKETFLEKKKGWGRKIQVKRHNVINNIQVKTFFHSTFGESNITVFRLGGIQPLGVN